MPAPQRTPACSPRASFRPYRSMLPAAMKSLGLALLALLLCPSPAHGLWCQDCTLANSSHCAPKQCQPTDTVCASVRITDPSSSRKDHSVNKMCASSCDFVKRHFFSDYLMGFINSGILKSRRGLLRERFVQRGIGRRTQPLGPGWGAPVQLGAWLFFGLGPKTPPSLLVGFGACPLSLLVPLPSLAWLGLGQQGFGIKV
uniref:UPAR/Ly6 domain-containing protein n=1 Tax=Mus musculus TaxID=10090 RepID=Q9D1X6_MOUSE|nr:unnamed protein product [Mus musculus]